VILVTGGAGFVGRHLLRRLAAGEAGPDAPLQASPAGRGDGL